MRIKIFNFFICCGLFTALVSCSSFLLTETSFQEHENYVVSDNNTLNDTILSMECSLLSIKTSAFENLSFPINNKKPSLTFINNGSFKGFALCNSFFGKYSKRGNSIKFRNSMMTRVNCGANDIESLITGTLSDVNNYSIKNNQLFLKRGSDVLMVFQIESSN
ncbi:MAG: META domain-containing protein [Paludibacter sp.]|nr:META domain-containing protein [Paludibacter sp.]